MFYACGLLDFIFVPIRFLEQQIFTLCCIDPTKSVQSGPCQLCKKQRNNWPRHEKEAPACDVPLIPVALPTEMQNPDASNPNLDDGEAPLLSSNLQEHGGGPVTVHVD